MALHSIPSAAAERHLLPGNILWTVLFGWWLALLFFAIAAIIAVAETIGGVGWKGKRAGGYARTVAGLGWYIGWPFGKYVEGAGFVSQSEDGMDVEERAERRQQEEQESAEESDAREDGQNGDHEVPQQSSRSTRSTSDVSSQTIRGGHRVVGADSGTSNDRIGSVDSWQPLPAETPSETAPLMQSRPNSKGQTQRVAFSQGAEGQARESLYGAMGHPNGEAKPTKFNAGEGKPFTRSARFVGAVFYWPFFILIIAPVLTLVCLICWGLVFTIPMAKLTWHLLRYLARGPLDIKFRSAPKVAVHAPDPASSSTSSPDLGLIVRRARLQAGQLAPTPGPDSTVLLCTYRAMGIQYYKYTIGGVNIIFINLLPLVIFTILDGMILLPLVERMSHPNRLLKAITNQDLIFVLSIASVIPLSYFIGMAVASISAQSSIGMGAVINATFGSIIEIILYSIALTQGKGRLVEGSIVGSLLAGVLLLPGGSMVSGAFARKEQKFNAKSAGVTSTMLIMAIIGTLTPTLFYQVFGSVSTDDSVQAGSLR